MLRREAPRDAQVTDCTKAEEYHNRKLKLLLMQWHVLKRTVKRFLWKNKLPTKLTCCLYFGRSALCGHSNCCDVMQSGRQARLTNPQNRTTSYDRMLCSSTGALTTATCHESLETVQNEHLLRVEWRHVTSWCARVWVSSVHCSDLTACRSWQSRLDFSPLSRARARVTWPPLAATFLSACSCRSPPGCHWKQRMLLLNNFCYSTH